MSENQTKENKMEANVNTISINGVNYVRADSVQAAPSGNRSVVVVDRGWIFAGDVKRLNGRIRLSRAVWVFRWESIGFDGVIANPKDKKVTIKVMQNEIDIPEGSEIFNVPVDKNWGL